MTPPAARPRSPGPFAAYEARHGRLGAGDGYQVAAAEVGRRGIETLLSISAPACYIPSPAHRSSRQSLPWIMLQRWAVGCWCCSQRRARLLRRASSLATKGRRLCYKGGFATMVALLRKAADLATKGNWPCYNKRPVLLPWRGVARRCYFGTASLLH